MTRHMDPGDVTFEFGVFRVMEAADVFEDAVGAASGEPPVRAAALDGSCGQQQRAGLAGGVERSFLV